MSSLVGASDVWIAAPLWLPAPIVLTTLVGLLRRPARRSLWVLILVPIAAAVVGAIVALKPGIDAAGDGPDSLIAFGLAPLIITVSAVIATVVAVPAALMISRIEDVNGRTILGLGLAVLTLLAGLVWTIAG